MWSKKCSMKSWMGIFTGTIWNGSMTENDLRKVIHEVAIRRGGHISWIESHVTSAGFPDADICVPYPSKTAPSVIVQMELKVVKSGGKIVIRPTQYAWFRDRVRAGGNPVLVVGSDDYFYVAHGVFVNSPSPIKTLADLLAIPHIKSAFADEILTAAIRMSQGETCVK